ncbi:hypothetical protein HHL28_04070 [Aerophototrophica crusticola]|uniref:Glycosyltransferase RgtA/B/C/D-like domain-containing protein n=1 Tax=Aerophototrophica crusticola TaxID=1709002 RepID=A0A858R4N8_9PROT|nr:hypothetical protein HHL28_04070 [Rhodospirillaceae bacterium B3]
MTHAPHRLTRLTPIHWALLVLVSLACFLPGFATIPPFDRMRAAMPRPATRCWKPETFVDIRYQEEARHKKPVGIYWMQAASVSLLTGGAEHGAIWMYRIPSLLGAIAAVLLTAWTASRLFGATVGLAAGLAMACTVILGVEARMAKTDAVLLATIVAAQGVLARIYLDREKPIPPPLAWCWPSGSPWASASWSRARSSSWSPAAPSWPCWRWSGGADWLRRLRPGIGIPVMLAVVLPWLVAIGIQTQGAFFQLRHWARVPRQGRHGAGEPWRPARLLPRHLLADLLALVAAGGVGAALDLAQPVGAGGALLPRLDHPDLAGLRGGGDQASHYRRHLPRHRRPDRRRRRWTGTRPGGAQAWLLALAGFLYMAVTLAFAAIIAGFPYQLTGSVLPLALLGGAVIPLHGGGRAGAGNGAGAQPPAAGRRCRRHPDLCRRPRRGVLAEPDPCGSARRSRRWWTSTSPARTPCWRAAGYTEPSMVFLVGPRPASATGAMVATTWPQPRLRPWPGDHGGGGNPVPADPVRQGPVPRQVAELQGFNYSRGKPATLRFYTLGACVVGRISEA